MSNVIYYCSNCGFEVSGSQLICPSCGAELENPSESEKEAYTSVIKTYNNYMEAEIAKSILESEGIICMIIESDAKSAYRTDFFNTPIRICVMEKDFEKGFGILDSYEKAKPIE